MKKTIGVFVIILSLFEISFYAQNIKFENKECFVNIGNENIKLGVNIDQVNKIKQYFTYKEIFYKDYGPLIWKSSSKFIPDSKYDILSYENNDIDIQAYRGNKKINMIKFKTDKYHIYSYWIGKRIDQEALLEMFNKYNNAYTIPIYENNIELGVLQISITNNIINELILTTRLD